MIIVVLIHRLIISIILVLLFFILRRLIILIVILLHFLLPIAMHSILERTHIALTLLRFTVTRALLIRL